MWRQGQWVATVFSPSWSNFSLLQPNFSQTPAKLQPNFSQTSAKLQPNFSQTSAKLQPNFSLQPKFKSPGETSGDFDWS
jgi:hypothetical protein